MQNSYCDHSNSDSVNQPQVSVYEFLPVCLSELYDGSFCQCLFAFTSAYLSIYLLFYYLSVCQSFVFSFFVILSNFKPFPIQSWLSTKSWQPICNTALNNVHNNEVTTSKNSPCFSFLISVCHLAKQKPLYYVNDHVSCR